MIVYEHKEGKPLTPWEKIKTEYITTSKSYKALSEQYGVPYGTLKIHARCDRWVEARQDHVKKTMELSLSEIARRQAAELTKVNDLADEMLLKLQKAIEELEMTVIQHKEKGESQDLKWEKTYEEAVPGTMVDRQGLRQLAASLKDLKQIKDLKTDLERMEQEARIEKLRKEGKEDMAQEITVTMDRETESYSS